MMRRLLPACLLVWLLAGTAAAQPATDPELTELYRLALSAEMCGFPVSPKQATAIGKAMDKRIAALKLSDDDSDKVYQQIETAMEAEGWDGLCAKGGAWEKTYREALRKHGK
jgi:hypothetical protein